jgi:Cytochrome C oxidase subunit II, periplasmic domain
LFVDAPNGVLQAFTSRLRIQQAIMSLLKDTGGQMRSFLAMSWLVVAAATGTSATAQSPGLSTDDLARIARICQSTQPAPFRSTADIQREVACNAAAVEMLRSTPSSAPSPSLWITASLGTWVYRYALDGATDTHGACVVSGLLTLPAGRPVALKFTSEDTIHEFQLPSLGVKATAVPGRIGTVIVRAETADMFQGTAVTAEGTAREQKASLSVRFLSPDDYARWESDTLRVRGCGAVR